jgi:hypothetical protein
MVDVVQSTVVIKVQFAIAEAALIEMARRAVAQTGRRVATQAQQAMVPGHFYDTGLSQQNTRWEQLSANGGQVHIATDYAAYPELGTHQMAPRPVLGPAMTGAALVCETLAAAAGMALGAGRGQTLPPPGAIQPPGAPVSRVGGQGQGGTP